VRSTRQICRVALRRAARNSARAFCRPPPRECKGRAARTRRGAVRGRALRRGSRELPARSAKARHRYAAGPTAAPAFLGQSFVLSRQRPRQAEARRSWAAYGVRECRAPPGLTPPSPVVPFPSVLAGGEPVGSRLPPLCSATSAQCCRGQRPPSRPCFRKAGSGTPSWRSWGCRRQQLFLAGQARRTKCASSDQPRGRTDAER
jgi:hypothetical protein